MIDLLCPAKFYENSHLSAESMSIFDYIYGQKDRDNIKLIGLYLSGIVCFYRQIAININSNLQLKYGIKLDGNDEILEMIKPVVNNIESLKEQ